MIYQNIYGRDKGYENYKFSTTEKQNEILKYIIASYEQPNKVKKGDMPRPYMFMCFPGEMAVACKSTSVTTHRGEMLRHSYVFTDSDMDDILKNPDRIFKIKDFVSSIEDADNVDVESQSVFNDEIEFDGIDKIKNNININENSFPELIKAIFTILNLGTRRIYILNNDCTDNGIKKAEEIIRLIFNYVPEWMIEKLGFLTYDKNIVRRDLDALDTKIKIVFVEDNDANRAGIEDAENSGNFIFISFEGYFTRNSKIQNTIIDDFLKDIYRSNSSELYEKLYSFYDYVYKSVDTNSVNLANMLILYKLFSDQQCDDSEYNQIYKISKGDIKNSILTKYTNKLYDNFEDNWKDVFSIKAEYPQLYNDIEQKILRSDKETSEKIILEHVKNNIITNESDNKAITGANTIIEYSETYGYEICDASLAKKYAQMMKGYIELNINKFDEYIVIFADCLDRTSDDAGKHFYAVIIGVSVNEFFKEFLNPVSTQFEEMILKLRSVSDTFRRFINEEYIMKANIVYDLRTLEEKHARALKNLELLDKKCKETDNELAGKERELKLLEEDIKALKTVSDKKEPEKEKFDVIIPQSSKQNMTLVQFGVYFLTLLLPTLAVIIANAFIRPDSSIAVSIINIIVCIAAFVFAVLMRVGENRYINGTNIILGFLSLGLIALYTAGIIYSEPSSENGILVAYKSVFNVDYDIEPPALSMNVVSTQYKEDSRIVDIEDGQYNVENYDTVLIKISYHDRNNDNPKVYFKLNDTNITGNYIAENSELKIESDLLADGLNKVEIYAKDSYGNESDITEINIFKMPSTKIDARFNIVTEIFDEDNMSISKNENNNDSVQLSEGQYVKVGIYSFHNIPAVLSVDLDGREIVFEANTETENQTRGSFIVNYSDLANDDNLLRFKLASEQDEKTKELKIIKK